MYAFFLIILLIAELAAAIVAVVYKDRIDSEIDALMTGALDKPTPEITEFMDLIQSSGCVPVFGAFLKRNLVIVACVAFGVCFFQLLSIVIACCLGRQIKEYENV
ncbi:uncharacterized protein DC041_0009427 [Schistosoma bovis]|uniref:Uncharacterized protein n=1 Tax=Schistosoma bovis TaxID=6184 RepID=A0A430QM78_SCHBO|nr:uncharacterized protein DC041_0009427 [Schistosoma bovis]